MLLEGAARRSTALMIPRTVRRFPALWLFTNRASSSRSGTLAPHAYPDANSRTLPSRRLAVNRERTCRRQQAVILTRVVAFLGRRATRIYRVRSRPACTPCVPKNRHRAVSVFRVRSGTHAYPKSALVVDRQGILGFWTGLATRAVLCRYAFVEKDACSTFASRMVPHTKKPTRDGSRTLGRTRESRHFG